MFRNDVVENHVQTSAEVHEEGGEGSPGVVAVLIPSQHQESKANVEVKRQVGWSGIPISFSIFHSLL